MASSGGMKVRGVTIEIGGDVTELSKALKGVNSDISKTQKELKDVEKLLKLDPSNTELLRQKHELLGKQVADTKTKLETLRKTEEELNKTGVDKHSEQYRALEREIISTEDSLRKLEAAAAASNVTLTKVSQTFGKISDASGKVAQATKGISTAAGGALAGIAGLAYKSVQAADDLNTLAKQTGISTAELQKMQYASDLIDVSVDSITGAMTKMKKNMASTSKDTQVAFQRIGVSVQDSNGQLRDATTVFYEVLEGLSHVANETERDTLAMQLFGRSADELAGIVDDGGAALRELGLEAEQLGLIMDQQTLDSLNNVNDAVDKLKAKANGELAQAGAKAMEALMPVFEKVLDAMSKALDYIGSLDEDQIKMLATLLAVTAAISPVAKGISNVTGLISKLTGAGGAVPKAIEICGKLTGTVLPKVVSALKVFPGLGLTAAIIALVALIATKGDEIQKYINKACDFIKGLLDKLFNWLNDHGLTTLAAFVKSIKDFIGDIQKVLGGIIDFIRGVFTGNWQRAWQGIVNIFSGIFGGIKDLIKAPINGVIGAINKVIGGFNKLRSVAGKSQVSTIPLLARGGIVSSGSAIVGDAGPELLTMMGGRAVVQPLTSSTTNNTNTNLGGVTINVYGAAGQNVRELADIIMDEMQAATDRKAAVFG
ncbi:MAG: hypothetical protein IKO00_01445 [Oscillospiraceae bacterium]|nr:hypothetical protein [Oscillospiraceae bacterium]